MMNKADKYIKQLDEMTEIVGEIGSIEATVLLSVWSSNLTLFLFDNDFFTEEERMQVKSFLDYKADLATLQMPEGTVELLETIMTILRQDEKDITI